MGVSNLQSHDAAAYREMLFGLLPRGIAWARVSGTRLFNLLWGMAAELERVDGRVKDLVSEMDWGTSDELLAGYEAVTGLTASGTTSERQDAVLGQFTAVGGQDAAYLIALALRAGFTITIETNTSMTMTPFRCGSSGCDEPIRGYPWAFAFVVHAASALTTAQRTTLQRLIDRHKPQHAVPHYIYDL